jgi:hypothetical protein
MFYFKGRLCREHLNGLLLEEYEHLQSINMCLQTSSSPATKQLFPAVYSFHIDERRNLCYYTLECLEGVSEEKRRREEERRREEKRGEERRREEERKRKS